MPIQKRDQTEVVDIQPIETRRLIVNVVGTSPFIVHRFAQKAWRELLLPSRQKNRAALEADLKHDPIAEYRGCFYRNRDAKAPTLFHVPAGMLHGAITSAALDIPGIAKTQLERLTSIVTPDIYLFGTPKMFMSMVRNSDQKHTPDVRTRPIFERWAIPNLTIEFKLDPLGDNQVINLLAAGGIIVGLGDWRPQKGGPYGKFKVVDANDAELREIMKTGARSAQQNAYEDPRPWDIETEELFSWYNAEVSRRETRVPSKMTKRHSDVAVKRAADAAEMRSSKGKANGRREAVA